MAAERRSIATLVDNLDAVQLATESLCAGWDVKTVAARLISDFTDGFWGFMVSGVRHGSMDCGIDALARSRARASPRESRDVASSSRSSAQPAGDRPVVGPYRRTSPWRRHENTVGDPAPGGSTARCSVLDFLTSPTQLGFFPRRRLRGIALHDDDTGQSWGDGELIRGPGMAVMLAICGRPVAFGDLAGPGVPVLQSRLT